VEILRKRALRCREQGLILLGPPEARMFVMIWKIDSKDWISVREEEIDLDFSGEIEELIGEVRWLAIFRVHTSKSFSHAALFKQMRNAWATTKPTMFKAKGDNLFLAQFHYLGDWERVMEGGPWLFRGAALAMTEYDGFTNVEDYKLGKVPVWTRIQGVPEGLMKKKELVEKVARKVG
jgi:hypothetical protein